MDFGGSGRCGGPGRSLKDTLQSFFRRLRGFNMFQVVAGGTFVETFKEMDQESSLEPKTCLERMAKHLVPHMLPKVIAGLLSQLRSVDLWWWMVWTPRPQ